MRKEWITSVFIAALLPALSAWLESADLGNGFYLMDQGGSKMSVAKDGMIQIVNIVTGTGEVGKFTVIESRGYYAGGCAYHVIDHERGASLPIEKLPPAKERITIEQAALSIEPLNSRSCKHHAPRAQNQL